MILNPSTLFYEINSLTVSLSFRSDDVLPSLWLSLHQTSHLNSLPWNTNKNIHKYDDNLCNIASN